MIRRYIAVIAAACLLSACATAQTVEVPTPVAPPSVYLRECVAEYVVIKTNADLVRQNYALKKALKLCNADKAALRAWAKAIEDGEAKDLLNELAESPEVPANPANAPLRGLLH